ncbi:MAG: esterase [Gammaproteobacteria bacterium TMED242]|uniref:Esterase n=1 Tax=SAR86 cluster bacterium TaxID=2030880 RepID=A0A520MPZ1_9GAMM|nr:MAG: esterase [Gammaproteobacteria bacterium TMED242]RZO23286.1 MAG: esterase [SAR86 cluster bacterium]|tara:strand:- start:3932 stop:4507 length:576 start_codon:yes stop_codon:yes gene_type:complete
MNNTILYFHGFKSSSDSTKAKDLHKFISRRTRNTILITPNIHDNFHDAHDQIINLIESNQPNIFFMGSSLGGYYASFFSQKYNKKAVLINPAIPPLKDFEMHLGKNKNYSNGNKFIITKNDIDYIRSLSYKKILKPKNLMILLESGDEILNYNDASSYFSGSHIDILYGGDHSYSSFKEKFNKIQDFLKIT